MSSCPVSTLHIRTLQSPLPPKPVVFPLQEATSEPSAEKLTPLTCELYFGCKLVTTLTTLCNGRLRLCRFLEVSGNTFVILVYASPPLNLRLSPGDRGGDATLRKGGSPMSGESPLALAVCDAPQLDCFAQRPSDELPRIPWVELDAGDI